MKNILLFLVCVFLFSCNKSNNQSESKATTVDLIPKKEKEFEMYELSEMAALMEQMYVDNERLKKRIKNGDNIGKFPNHFLKIHKAVMTDSTDNDTFFKQQANAFIKAQTLIYEDPKNAKQHFNDGVSACVACHQVKCSGPIPRIKKLYIE